MLQKPAEWSESDPVPTAAYKETSGSAAAFWIGHKCWWVGVRGLTHPNTPNSRSVLLHLFFWLHLNWFNTEQTRSFSDQTENDSYWSHCSRRNAAHCWRFSHRSSHLQTSWDTCRPSHVKVDHQSTKVYQWVVMDWPGLDLLLVQSFDQMTAQYIPQLQVGFPLRTVLSLCNDRITISDSSAPPGSSHSSHTIGSYWCMAARWPGCCWEETTLAGRSLGGQG